MEAHLVDWKIKRTSTLAAALALALSGCAGSSAPPAGPPDPATMAGIIRACTFSGLFKEIDQFGTLAPVPGIGLAISLVNAGVDRVCANPAQYAADVTTVKWLVQQFSAAGKPVPLVPGA